MADPRIRIIVDAVTAAAEANLKKLQGTVRDTGEAGSKAGKLFEGFGGALTKIGIVAGGAVAGVMALKKVLDFGKEGAAIAQTKESFDRLMGSLGTTGPQALQALRDASRGTVDDVTLMSGALTLVAGASDEVAKAMVGAAPQLMEIAKAAQKLNPNLGTTAQLYQSLALGIKRAQPEILDNLGLTLKLGEAYASYAKKLGKSAEELTAQEKQMAILNATLEAGDAMIRQVGGSTAAMGDEFAQAEVKIKNASDAIKAQMAPAIADLTTKIAEGIPKVADSANNILLLAEAGLKWVGAALTGEDATAAFNLVFWQTVLATDAAKQAQEEWVKQLGFNIVQEEAAKGAISNLADAVGLFGSNAEAAVGSAKGMASAVGASVGPTDTAAKALENAAGAAEAFDANLESLHELISGTVTADWEAYKEALAGLDGQLASGAIKAGEYKTAIENLTAAYEENTSKVIYNIAEKQILNALEQGLIRDTNASGTAYDEASNILLTLAGSLGIVDEGTLALSEKVIGMVGYMLAGGVTAETLGKDMNSLAGEIGNAALQGDGLISTIDSFPPHKNVLITHNFPEAEAAADGVRDTVDAIHSKRVQIEIDIITRRREVGGAPANEPYQRQHGGPVRAGGRYLVGEAGPEMFVPTGSGYIVPNNVINNNHNYNLTIHSNAPAESALSDFHILKALAGV